MSRKSLNVEGLRRSIPSMDDVLEAGSVGNIVFVRTAERLVIVAADSIPQRLWLPLRLIAQQVERGARIADIARQYGMEPKMLHRHLDEHRRAA